MFKARCIPLSLVQLYGLDNYGAISDGQKHFFIYNDYLQVIGLTCNNTLLDLGSINIRVKYGGQNIFIVQVGIS